MLGALVGRLHQRTDFQRWGFQVWEKGALKPRCRLSVARISSDSQDYDMPGGQLEVPCCPDQPGQWEQLDEDMVVLHDALGIQRGFSFNCGGIQDLKKTELGCTCTCFTCDLV